MIIDHDIWTQRTKRWCVDKSQYVGSLYPFFLNLESYENSEFIKKRTDKYAHEHKKARKYASLARTNLTVRFIRKYNI